MTLFGTRMMGSFNSSRSLPALGWPGGSLAAREHPLQGATALVRHFEPLRPDMEQAGLLETLNCEPIQLTRMKVALGDVAKGEFFGGA